MCIRGKWETRLIIDDYGFETSLSSNWRRRPDPIVRTWTLLTLNCTPHFFHYLLYIRSKFSSLGLWINLLFTSPRHKIKRLIANIKNCIDGEKFLIDFFLKKNVEVVFSYYLINCGFRWVTSVVFRESAMMARTISI